MARGCCGLRRGLACNGRIRRAQHRHRNHNQRQREGRNRKVSHGQCSSGLSVIENISEASFDDGRAGEWHRHCPRRFVETGRADLHNLSRVIGLSNARTDHQIVAGAFSLGFHLPKCNPAQRIEPIDCPGNLRDQMGQTIQPLDVRQLVRQRGLAPGDGPIVCFRRQQ